MPRILVVEDDPHIARIMQIKLTNNAFDVLIATDGAGALTLMHEYRPDLMLLEVMMPVMDGYQVLRAIREDPDFSALPVIMLAAKGQERDILAGFKGGANDYIVKPFSPAELVVRVQRLLKRG
jgi:two-component system OmpR family response regulator